MRLGLGLTLGQPVEHLFDPGDISGVSVWLRPQKHVSLSGSDVTSWTDDMNGVVFTAGTNKPTYNPDNSDFNDQPTLHWSSAANENLVSSQTMDQPASYFIICKCDDQSSTRTLIALGQIIQASLGPTGILVNAGVTGVFGTSLLTGGVHSVAVVIDGANTSVYLDGVSQTLSAGAQNVGSNSNTNTQIGFTSVSWVGDIADVVMWSEKSLTADEVVALHGYATRLYGAA